MAVMSNEFLGGYDVYCGECGVKLCWSISEEEYLDHVEFWDNYSCEDCNPDATGAWLKANPERKPFRGVREE